jgi:hypothetical protein
MSGGQLSYWEIYGWQVQTYADLRQRQEDSLPVVAGVVIYLNELFHTRSDFELPKRRLRPRLPTLFLLRGARLNS